VIDLGHHSNIYLMYVRHMMPGFSAPSRAAVNTLTHISQYVVRSLGFFVQNKENLEESYSRFAEFLEITSQHLLLQKFVHYLPYKNGRILFLLGKGLVSLGDYYKAQDTFITAANYDRLQTLNYLWEIVNYYDTINLPQFTCFFARRAIQLIAAEKDHIGDEWLNRKNKLWVKIFLHELNMAQFENACHAINAINDIQLKRTCLRNFVTIVCEAGEGKLLSAFPFSKHVQSEIENILEFKARNSPVALDFFHSSPNYYKIIYALYVHKKDYKKASKAMYHYGKRLHEENSNLNPPISLFYPPLLAQMEEDHNLQSENLNEEENQSENEKKRKRNQHQPESLIMAGIKEEAMAYLTSMFCLSLVDKNHSWIIAPVFERTRRKIQSDEEGRDNIKDIEHKEVKIKEMIDIEQDYLIALAKLALFSSFPHLASQEQVEPDILLEYFIKAGKYSPAMVFATQFKLDYTPVFQSLAELCFNAHRNNIDDIMFRDAGEDLMFDDEDITNSNHQGNNSNNNQNTLNWDDIEVSSFSGNNSNRLWVLLRNLLEKYDTRRNQNSVQESYRYHVVVLEKLFSLSDKFVPPSWLLQLFQLTSEERFLYDYIPSNNQANKEKSRRICRTLADGADLLKAYIKYNRLEEAADYALFLINKNHQALENINKSGVHLHSFSQYLPYSIINHLLQLLESKGDDKTRGKLQQIQTELKAMFQISQQLSENVISKFN